MLVLSLKKNQRAFVEIDGELAEVIIVEVRGKSVRVGFRFPKGIRIVRDELMEEQVEDQREREVVAAAAV